MEVDGLRNKVVRGKEGVEGRWAKEQGGKEEGRGWLKVDGLRNKVVRGIWNAVERLRNKKRAWVTE